MKYFNKDPYFPLGMDMIWAVWADIRMVYCTYVDQLSLSIRW